MNIKTLLSALSPFNTLKLWTISFSDWSGGSFKSFWFKKNALKHAEENKDSAIFINIENESNGNFKRL